MSHPLPEFQYKISLGQNFIFDEVLLNQLVEETPIRGDDIVLEIGAGRGDLTLSLSKKAKQVVTVEIDERLEKVLIDRFVGFENIRLVMGDIMKMDLTELMAGDFDYHVVANLPYYLTTPILSRLFRETKHLKSVNVMVQKEAALRVLAAPGTPEYGPLAVMAALRGTPREAVFVPASCFTPPPKVDSVFMVIPLHENLAVDAKDFPLFEQVVEAAFLMRRKTLVNNLMRAFSLTREAALTCLLAIGLEEKTRGETLNLQQFLSLFQEIKKIRD